MLTTKEVLDAFDAIGNQSMHNQVLKNELNQRGYDHDDVATAIETAIRNEHLAMTRDGFISRRVVPCAARFRLSFADKTYVAHGNPDGSWLVAEHDGRVLAAPGAPHPSPMQVIKNGKSATPDLIAEDVASWAREYLCADVVIESF